MFQRWPQNVAGSVNNCGRPRLGLGLFDVRFAKVPHVELSLDGVGAIHYEECFRGRMMQFVRS